ncbi:dnaJ homolog subfamily C member 13 isoform X2 [Cimex lectularius]|uniref:J domain-containing protein n=1 Tax=Cimex lectularius TaxID=79782 RepID=A0A8I6TIJ6_CIMLE|nr:dnaJ homolog subfamily C member 13 isoform X2 [Cimex lectularius]
MWFEEIFVKRSAKMMPLPHNQDIFCYLVNKHSTWKVRYKRVFSFGTQGITTYNPETLEVTNRWLYCDILSVKRVFEKPGKFIITFRKDKNKKVDTMCFSTEHRAEVLSVSSQFRFRFSEKPSDSQKYEAQKLHWSGTRLPIVLDVTPTSLDQLDAATNHLLAKYEFKDIESIYELSKVADTFVVVMKNFGRMHLFVCQKKVEIKKKIEENSSYYLGIDIKIQVKAEQIDYFIENRFGNFSGDEYCTSLTEFNVEKYTSRSHQDPQQRLLCITQTCILERDPETYNIVTLRPLTSIFALIREYKNPRLFTVEYTDMSSRTYSGANRDSILATILEGARGIGNKDIHVKMKCTCRGKRWGPYHTDMEEEVETVHLRLLKDSIGKKGMSEMIERFNANVPYSGLLHSVTQDGIFKENKEKPIVQVLNVITTKIKDTVDTNSLCDEELEALYHAIRRLVASKTGFSSFTQLNGFRESLGFIVVKGLNRNNEAMTHAAVDMICALMRPMHEDYDLKQEQQNKSSLLSKEDFLNKLLDRWTHYVNSGTGALVVAAMLDMLTFALCLPYSETTEGRYFDALLQLVAKRGRCLFKHFQHPCVTIVKGASLLMQAIIEEAEQDVARNMQELALSESALPRHLLTALFTPKTDLQMYTQCKLSRQLVGLWLAGNNNGMELLKRLLPSGLLAYLESDEIPPKESDDMAIIVRDNLKLAQDHANKLAKNPHLAILEKRYRLLEKHIENTFEHWGARLGKEKRNDKLKFAPVVLRKSRQQIKSNLNWALFYYKFNHNHSLPNLIWNHKTRDELRNALDKEVKAFDANRELTRGNVIAWNYSEFEVIYASLKDQLCIDGYYIKVLLDCRKAPESLSNISTSFFNNLYHRFLVPTAPEIKCMCLEALAMVYECYHESIGYFSDTKHIVNMLERTADRLERDRLILFLKTLTHNKANVKDIIVNSSGITILVDLMTLAHLHTSRAYVPTQTNVIEYGNSFEREQEKEWHYCSTSEERKEDNKNPRNSVSFKELKELYNKGVINNKTKCWAQGMHNWRPLQNITQLKWTLLAKGNSILNESELAITILNMMIRMIEYYPSRNKDNAIICPMSKIKELLSSEHCIHHIVQLLLTFEPIIVEKVATLLCCIAEDNIYMPKLYTTGVFYFILMYNGSNVLPIAKFLKMTHSKQTFRGEENYTSELMQRSILGQLLPEAMVNYLENHGPEKFAQIFLGEFDTPEAIWNAEMRRMLTQKIAAHIADFTPRLWSNNKAQYQYIVIPVVKYPQLLNELFCNIFYLRHLCDTTRFPDWPINDPVSVLRDVLEAWTGEVEKKPPVMSCDEAYAILNLPTGQHHDEPVIRKAYYHLAQKYHPDKNSEGRPKFEAVNKAYDFLCSRSSWNENGINTNNIILILQTQSILFDRYSQELQPYKYAGYKQLIKTIQLEANDEHLFSKQTLLLQSAIELIYHTIKCSALNAEEFNRENGFQVTLVAFERCVSILSESTTDNDSLSQICLHCTKSFTIAASFHSCRETFQCLPNLIPDILRVLHFKNLIKLNCAVVECVSALTVDPFLQMSLLNHGILWYLLSYLFLYDFTLEECGIESTQEDNQQKAWNEIAKLSVEACARISGYKDSNDKSPHNPKVKSILSMLLTPYLANMIMDDQPEQVLKILTSNCETPYLIWNNSTRAELNEFLEQRKQMRDQSYNNVTFSSSVYSSELIIGGIYIRIYNEQPTYKITNVKEFVLDILDYLKENTNKTKLEEESNNILMALTAFNHVVHKYQDVAIQCIGQMKLLFSMLMLDNYEQIQLKTLQILSQITKIQECVNDVAACGVLLDLLLVLYSLPTHQSIALNILHNLITSSAIVKEIITKGGVQYLLDILLNSKDIDVKTKTAVVLGRLIEDKVSGQRIKLNLLQALPDAICDALVDSSDMAITILLNNQENPEIIWNDVHREQLSKIISEHCKKQYCVQKQNPDIAVKMPDLSSINSTNELFIGRVYLRLYNNNPTWSLRKPVKFLSDLLDALVKIMLKPQSDTLDPVGNALTNVLTYNTVITNDIPALGHLPKLFSQWTLPNANLSKHLLKMFNLIFANEICVNSISQIDCISCIKEAIKAHPELTDIGCDCLSKLFSFKHESLIKTALETGLISFLLGLLGDNLSLSENPARAKAFIVKALKSMISSVTYGSNVEAALNKSPIWSAYSEQKHDLFITNSTSAPYLTGPTTAGYLTQGTKPMPSVPPPVEDISHK